MAYREKLQELETRMQSEYDKAVMTLSGGAIGISFAFIKDICLDRYFRTPGLLIAAWIIWGMSIVSVLFSYQFSVLAMRKAVDQLDESRRTGVPIDPEEFGGFYNKWTWALNFTGGALFLVGVMLLGIFVSKNLG